MINLHTFTINKASNEKLPNGFSSDGIDILHIDLGFAAF